MRAHVISAGWPQSPQIAHPFRLVSGDGAGERDGRNVLAVQGMQHRDR